MRSAAQGARVYFFALICAFILDRRWPGAPKQPRRFFLRSM